MEKAGMPLKQALKDVDLYQIIRINLPALKTELASVRKREGIYAKGELFIKIIKNSYPNLLY